MLEAAPQLLTNNSKQIQRPSRHHLCHEDSRTPARLQEGLSFAAIEAVCRTGVVENGFADLSGSAG
eukprot:m.291072 g.291072  ORF g.291072 m.291072 type:complete len:66 (+) comp55089_c0_seq1:937-1134(+)